MAKGRIKSFDYSTGSGLIEPESGGEVVIVHFSAVKSKSQRTLQAGQFVQFETSRDAAGLRAINVEILDNFSDAPPMVAPDISHQPTPAAASPHRNSRNSRKKTKLWPLGIGAVAVVAALFVALSARQSVQPTKPSTAATPSVRAVSGAAKPRIAKPLAQKPIAVQAPPAPLPGEKFAQTRLRELAPEETDSLTPEQLQYALNEIYARHGYRFATSRPRRQFARFAWYKPVKGQSEVASWQQFSAIEKRNAQRLNQARTAQREEQARQTQIAQDDKAERKRVAEQEQQAQIARRQIAQTRQNEPEPRFDLPTSSEGTIADSPSSAPSETPDFSSSGDTTPTGFPIFTGPRGGRYHISKNGNKVYEKRR